MSSMSFRLSIECVVVPFYFRLVMAASFIMNFTKQIVLWFLTMTINLPGITKAMYMYVEDNLFVILEPYCVCWTVAMDRESVLLAEGFWVRSLTTNRNILR